MSIANKLEYLKETKNQIKTAITDKGVTISDTDTFRSYADKIRNIETGGTTSSDDWQPEPDWWDIETILENDTEDYSQKIICLLTDELDDKSTTNTVKGAEKYKLSDGQVVEQSASASLNITNKFDTTQDKVCSKDYKTRYIIYYKNSDFGNNITLPNNTIYVIFSGVKFSAGCFSNTKFLQAVRFANDTKFTGTNMNSMFNNCYTLIEIPNMDTSNVTSMSNMFGYCYNLKKIQNLDTSNVTSMSNMFGYCYNLKEISNLDTSNVTSMNSMFNNCYSLKEISNLDTSNVTSMNSMFNNCYSLKEIPNLDTSNVTSMNYMFNGCYNLRKTPNLDTSKAKNIGNMFGSCYNLKQIPNLDASNATTSGTVFINCNSLTNIQNISNIKVNISFSSSNYLNHSTLLRILNALVDLTDQTTQTLTLGSTNLTKLKDEEKAIATNKNWTLA